MPFLKLPGWISIATGVLQFVITVGGITLGTAGAYLSAHSEQQGLLAERQRLKGEMNKLAQHMQQLIQQCKLRIAIPPPFNPQPQPQVQPPQPTCMEEYEECNYRFKGMERDWQELESKLRASSVAFSAAVMSAVTWSSSTSAYCPLGIAYIAWVLGIVMLCLGYLWLALVQRIFPTLATP